MKPRCSTCSALALAASTLVTACGCKANLGWRLDPKERTIAVGESFTPTIQFLGCNGTEPLRDDIVWHARDTMIVYVDSLSGHTTGLRAGTTSVVPTGKKYGTVDEVVVTVQAR